MTTGNPFSDRLRTAAQEGYVDSTRREPSFTGRSAYREFAAPNRGASAPQIALILSLLDERDLAAETRPKFKARLAELNTSADAVLYLDRKAASNLITYLFGLPQAFGTTHEPAAFAEVPAGHYALIRNDGVCFVRVDRPTKGKWAGRVFVSLQHGGDYTNMSRAAGFTMLGSIVDQGVLECSIRYGRELGKCGGCHRKLTNAESRAAGIEPVCRADRGW